MRVPNLEPCPVRVENAFSRTVLASRTEHPIQIRLEPRATASWIYPPPNNHPVSSEVFNIGDVVEAQWTTDLDEYFVFLWQQDLTKAFASVDQYPLYSKFVDAKEVGGFNWTVSTGVFSLSNSNIFFFALGPNISLTSAFTNNYFNLTEKAIASITTSKTTSSVTTSTSAYSSSTSSLSISASTTPTTKSSVSSARAIASPASTLSAAQTSSTLTSSATKLGIGLSVGLGIPIILLLSTLVYLKLKSTKKPSISENSVQQMHFMQGSTNSNVQTTFYYKAELPGNGAVGELDANRAISELL